MSYNIGHQIIGVTSRKKYVVWGKIVGLDDNNYMLELGGILSDSDNFTENKKEGVEKIISLKKNQLLYKNYLLEDTKNEAIEIARKIIQDEKQDAVEQKMEKMERDTGSPVVFPMDEGGGKKKKRRKKTRRRGRKTRNKKKNQRKTKKLSNGKEDRCAPKPEGDRLPFSCYTKESLHKIKDIWNKRNPEKQILSNDPKTIWRGLKTRLSRTCKRESCWLKQKFIKENIDKEVIKYTFRPKRPKTWKKKKDEWLNSNDITKFMNQYEHRHKDFKFLGPSPINYDTHLMSDECVWEELCKFELKNMKSSKTKIGIIFNLDPHYKSGSHWVALFINTKDKCIYYFDSYGDKIPTGIMKFVKKIQNQSSNIGPEYEFKQNKKRHQYSNSECGMFSLHFIRSMILYNNWNELSTKKLSDKEMLRLRKVYYNP